MIINGQLIYLMNYFYRNPWPVIMVTEPTCQDVSIECPDVVTACSNRGGELVIDSNDCPFCLCNVTGSNPCLVRKSISVTPRFGNLSGFETGTSHFATSMVLTV